MTTRFATERLNPVKDVLAVFLVAWLLIAASMSARSPTVPVADAIGYVRLALGLSDFGVFGYFANPVSPPKPDSEVTPLYPAFLAGLIRLDSGLHGALQCWATHAGDAAGECPRDFSTMARAQGLLMAVFLFTVWMTGWLLSRSRVLAWLAMAMAWYSGLPVHYANLFLTEALVLPLFGMFLLFLGLIYLYPGRWYWAAGAGLILGLLALTRPSFTYLFWFLAGAGVLATLGRSLRVQRMRSVCVFCLGFALMTLPWVARNYSTFHHLMLSGGKYGGKTLAYRVSYNNMTAAEWGVAFIYWFPDIGDSLAKSLFPARLYERLGYGGKSYYRAGDSELQQAIRASGKSAGSPVRYLLKNKILAHPVKHTLVTLALAWRGMFIHKYWSLFGWIGSLWLLGRTLRSRRYAYAFLWTPGLFMLFFHAAVSVSIPRYNVILTPLLSIAIAYLLLDIVSRRLGGGRFTGRIAGERGSELYTSPKSRH